MLGRKEYWKEERFLYFGRINLNDIMCKDFFILCAVKLAKVSERKMEPIAWSVPGRFRMELWKTGKCGGSENCWVLLISRIEISGYEFIVMSGCLNFAGVLSSLWLDMRGVRLMTYIHQGMEGFYYPKQGFRKIIRQDIVGY